MDQIKIGKFIAAMRKKQELSQKQLAQRLGVTDKTISKWETGNRMPDASVLLKLSMELKIDVNELLAGEEFLSEEVSSEQYVTKSESNLVKLVDELNENAKERKGRGIGTILGMACIALAFMGLIGSSLPMGRIADIFDLPTLFYLFGAKILILSIFGRFHDYLNAWKACFAGTELSIKEMKSAVQAVKYVAALSLTLGGLMASVGLFSLLNYLDDLTIIGPGLAQIVLAFFYTSIAETSYVILLFRIKGMLADKGTDQGTFD